MSRTYFFIRHATPVNDAGSFHISGFETELRQPRDLALSAMGQAQARALAPALVRLGAERLVSSTLLRAVETASILSAETGIPHDGCWPEAVEIAPGVVSPRRQAGLRRLATAPVPGRARPLVDALRYRLFSTYYLIQWRLDRTRGGESRDEVMARIGAVLRRLDHLPEQRIALVGHGYWIATMALDTTASRGPKLLRMRWVRNCSITRVTADGFGRYQLDYMGAVP